MASTKDGGLPLPSRWLRGLAGLVAVGAALFLGAMIATDAGRGVEALARLGVLTAFVGTLVASIVYFGRFARWQWLRGRLGHRIAPGYTLRVYLAGLALTSSPGKLGETVRSVLLLRKGVPAGGSLGAFLADRGAEVVGMAALGMVASRP